MNRNKNLPIRVLTTDLRVGDVVAISGLEVLFIRESKRPNHTRVGLKPYSGRVGAGNDWHNLSTTAVFRKS